MKKLYEVYRGWTMVGQTWAVSPKQAINNMKYRLGTKFGEWSAVECTTKRKTSR